MRVRRVRYASPRRRDAGLPRHHGGRAPRSRRPGGRSPGSGARSARAAREEVAAGADLIHAHWWVPAGLAAPPDVPLVLTAHGTDAAHASHLPARARGSRGRCSRRARVVTAVSRELASLGRRTPRAGTSRRTTCTPCRSTPRPGPGPRAAAVRSWSPASRRRSGSAWPSRPRRSSPRAAHDLPLTVVGDGPERDALERQVERLGHRALRPLRRRRRAERGDRVPRPTPTSCSFRPRARASAWRPPKR